MSTVRYQTKPHKSGKVFPTEPAQDPYEVIERARAVLSPRGAWKKGGYRGECKLGATRCLRQALDDSDGAHIDAAARIVLRIANEVCPPKNSTYGKWTGIPSFNDNSTTTKMDVLHVLDEALARRDKTHG